MPWTTITADDGNPTRAFRADPNEAPRGGLVVLHEVAGIDAHVRGLVEQLARAGFAAIAPALFDRVEPNLELGYTALDLARGVAVVRRLDWFRVMLDVRAMVGAVATAGKVGIIGYSFGGTVAWLAAARLHGLACAVAYNPSYIVHNPNETPRVPVLLHVGLRDRSLPIDRVRAIAAKTPDRVELHEYDAGHGFHGEGRDDYDVHAATESMQRTLAFVQLHTGAKRD